MTVTETTTEGFGSRLGTAFKGVLVGGGLFLISFVILFWNEGRTVKRYKALKEAQGVIVAGDASKVNPSLEGKLVYMTGRAETNDVLKDELFSIDVKAIKLLRTVTMYQWTENAETKTRKKVGGGTETVTKYSYSKKWTESPIDSSSFKTQGHDNPQTMKYQSQEFVADRVTFGAFDLSKSLINRIGPAQQYSVQKPGKSASNKNEASPVDPSNLNGNSTGQTQATATAPDKSEAPIEWKYNNGELYIGSDPGNPVIGDLRISFSIIPEQDVSIASQQTQKTFVPYMAKTGKVELLRSGLVSMEEMFVSAQSENRMFAWLLRGAGLLCMFLGISMILRPISVFGDVIPFIGNIIGFGTGIFAFITALGFSLITIAIAWLFYRPMLSIPLLVLAGALIVVLISRIKKNASSDKKPQDEE